MMAAATSTAHSTMLRQALKPWHRMPVCQHHVCRQASTSTYQQQTRQQEVEPLPAHPKPPAATWYTGRPALNSFLDSLQATLKTSRSKLYHQGYLTSVSQDVRTITPIDTVQPHRPATGVRWLSAEDMASKIGTSKVRLAYYRQITGLLSELQALLPYLQEEGSSETIEQLLKKYSRPNVNAAATSLLSAEDAAALAISQASNVGGRENNRGYGYLARDSGISFAIGRKKTASARAWILPLPVTAEKSSEEPASKDASTESTEVTVKTDSEPEPALGQILINNKPISTYFPTAAERSLILRPFTLTDNLGKYNVFVLVAGSGISSQAQAVAVACARALAARDLTEENFTRQILSKGEYHLSAVPAWNYANFDPSSSRHVAKRSKSGGAKEDR